MSETASITLDNKKYDLSVVTGTENEKAIDISKLRDLTGYITLDSGYKTQAVPKVPSLFWMARKAYLNIGVILLSNLRKNHRL